MFNIDDQFVEDFFQTRGVVFLGVVVLGIAVVTTPDLDVSDCVGVGLDNVDVVVVEYGCWGGEGEDTKGEEGKSGESERTHCRWLMSVGKRVTG